MKSIITFLIVFISTATFSQQWYKYNPTAQHLKAVHFVNSNTGWIAGSNGTILKTTDAGATWMDKSLSISTTVYDMYFFSANVGVVCCGNGRIYKTTNGGADWEEKNVGNSSVLLGMQFLDSQRGYIVGGSMNDGKIFRTSDGGDSWSSIPSNYLNQLRTVHFFSNSKGLVAGIDGKIWKTTNTGDDWYRVGSSPTGTIFKFFYFNSNLSYVGSASVVLKTTSGDTLWTDQIIPGIPFGTSVYSLYFVSEIEGWCALEDGYIAHTSNGGNDWELQSSNVSVDLNNVFFVDGSRGYIVGNSGVLLSTVLLSDINTEEGQLPSSFELSQNYPNPFNPTTKIRFTIPSNVKRQTSNVILKIFDVLGNEVATLVNEYKPAGSYEIEFNPASSIKNPATGVYFYQLRAGSFIETKKMLLIK